MLSPLESKGPSRPQSMAAVCLLSALYVGVFAQSALYVGVFAQSTSLFLASVQPQADVEQGPRPTLLVERYK